MVNSWIYPPTQGSVALAQTLGRLARDVQVDGGVFFVYLPFSLFAQNGNPGVEIVSPTANTCVNSGTGQDCQTTADCIDVAKGGTGQACTDADECNRTGIPCAAAADCEAAGAGTLCAQGECFFETQVCSNDGRCFERCQTASDCGEGPGHVCSDNRCFFSDYICRQSKCVTENGLIGGAAAPDPQNVSMTIRLSDPRSRDLSLQFKAEWTATPPLGRVCPNNQNGECDDERLTCQNGVCVERACGSDDDCNCADGQCTGTLTCENAVCVQKGDHAFEVGYTFSEACQPGQPCTEDTDEFEFLGFLIGDSPATTITVNVKKACDEVPATSAACTSCQRNQDCGPGKGCSQGSCINLAGPQGACGPGLRGCGELEQCVDGVCVADLGVECGADEADANPCLPAGTPIEMSDQYQCVRGTCVALECLTDAQCVPNGQEAAARTSHV